jgi:subtilisin-like proprotein convertase family protein/subtilisin family serine protease
MRSLVRTRQLLRIPTRPNNRLQPRILQLEDRSLPSASLSVYNRGDFYRADGSVIELDRRTDLLTVKVDAAIGQTAVNELLAVGGPLQGFSVLRTLNPDEFVLQSPPTAAVGPNIALADDADPRLALVVDTPGVIWTAPVFHSREADNWMAVTDEIIVALHDGADAPNIFSRDGRFSDYRPLVGTPDQFIVTLAGQSGVATLSISEALLSDPRIEWTSPNFWQNHQRFFTPNDSLYPQQWHLNSATAGIKAPTAWDITPGGSSSIAIAIVDDGIELTHPDLQPNIWVNTGEIPGDGIDNDGNGWIDDVNGWDFTANDNNPGPDSANDAHGTATAGVAAGKGNNSIGIAGAAFNSKILPSRIFAGASATSDANIASAIYYAAGRTANGLSTWNAAQITSNSWGGGSSSSAITSAFTWASNAARGGKGVPSFIATGNNSSSSVSYPANLSGTVTGVIAVGASTNSSLRASYSNYGNQVDILAPSDGGSLGITTTDRTGSIGYSSTDYTSSFGGTSSATPLAAGVGALVMALDSNLTAAQIRGLLRNTTEYIGPVAYNVTTGFNTEYGYGRVNAFNAVSGVGKPEIQLLDGITDIADGTGVVNFGSVGIGSNVTKTFRIRNQGTLPLTLGSLSVAAPFSIVSNFGSTTLQVGQSTTFTLSFTPTASGLQSQTVTFINNDADEGNFDFVVQGTGLSANITGRIYEDRNADGVLTGVEPGIASALAFLDTNNNGWLDRVPAQNLPLAIPNPGPIYSSLTVAGFTGTVNDVNVTLTINHTRLQDLDIYIVGPTGAKVELSTDNGGSNANYTDTTFDDQAAISITAGTAPFTGSFRPEGSLATFNGLNPNGVWTLQVIDDSSQGTAGTLVSWSIQFNNGPTEPVAITNSTGYFEFQNVAAGNYTVRRLVPDGMNASGPDFRSVTLPTSSSLVTDQDFGVLRANAIYGRVFQDLVLDGVPDAGDPSIVGRRVFVDVNNNGVFNSFAALNSTAVTIPDNNATGATSSIVASNIGIVSRVRVRVSITHTWVGDLSLSLISPSGTSIPLATNWGGTGDNFVNTWFDDAATLPISSGVPPFTGTFRPETPLSTLAGQNANGTWQLKVVDNAAGDTGTINNWTLELFEPNALSDADGQYALPYLVPGLQRVRQVLPGGWFESAPVGGVYEVAVIAGQSYVGRDFGSSDSIPPLTVTVNQAINQDDPTNDSVINFTAVFSAPVNNFDASDVIIGGTTGATMAVVTGSGTTYNIAVSGMTQTGDVIVTIPANAASTGFQSSEASTSFDNSVRYDATPPTAVAGALPNITTASASAYTFQVTFADETAVDVMSIATGVVRVTGPGGFDIPAELVSIDNPTDGTPRVATFAVPAPTGGWSSAHDGAYQLHLQSDQVADIIGNTMAASLLGTFNVAIAPSVALFQINDGNLQRSVVRSFTVAFSGLVQLPANPSDAFTLTRTGPGGPTGPVALTIDTATLSTSTQTIAKITFSGALTEAGSLRDGRYDFTVLGAQVTSGGVPLTGNYEVSQLHRLFGDANGDGVVTANDFNAFRLVYGTSDPASIFDINGDDQVTAFDFNEFRLRYGMSI